MTVLTDVEVDRVGCDVRLAGDVVVEVGSLAGLREEIVEGRGGALLPGLHDHGIHLLGMGVANRSVVVSTGSRP